MLLLQLATGALLLVLFRHLAKIRERLASIDGTLAKLAVAHTAEDVLARTAPAAAQDAPAPQAGRSTDPWKPSRPPRPKAAEAARPSAPGAPTLAAPVPLPPAPAPSTPGAAPASAPASAPARPAVDLELRFGRRWAALLGGGVVAFGLALLVRHSIQQGWFPPSVRLLGAALLSLALCGTAELFRRRGTFAAPNTAGLAGRAADVPSILLGTGLAGLFAVAYATYGVYGYVGPAPAFLAMAAAALGGIAASFAYGPALGILGYLAAESVPFLVVGNNDVAGAAYVALVGAGGYAAAYRGRWQRLENPAGVILLLWAGLLRDGGLLSLTLVSVPAGALAVGVTALRLRPRAAWASRRPSPAASVALGLAAGHGLLLAAHVARASNLVGFQPMAPVLGLSLLLLGFGFAATATRARAMAPGLAAAAVAALAAMDPALLARPWQHRLIFVGFAPYHLALALGAVSAAGLAVAVAALHQASRRSSITALTGATSAAGLLAGGDLVLRLGGVMDHWTLAAIALAQGAGLLVAARPRNGAIPAAREFGSAVAASAAVGLLAFALAVTEPGHGSLLTLVLAMTAAGAAGLAVAWRTPLFASVAGLASVPVILRAASRAAYAVVGSPDAGVALWPILEDTLLPGLVLGGAAVLLARRIGARAAQAADRRWLELSGIAAAQDKGPAVSLVLTGMAAGGLLLGALVAAVRWTAYGNAYAPLSAPSDPGLACALALSAAVAASHLHRATGLRALGRASRVLAVAAVPFLALAVLLNPFVTGASLGAWRFLNLLVLAYALPGVLAWRLAREAARPDAPDAVTRRLAGGMAIAGLLSYVTFTVSHLFQGAVLQLWQVSEGELWTHTVVWLAMGVGTLAYGLWVRGRVLRLTALGIVAAVAVKVTFVDLAHLTGAARALSVITLGLVLLGIGMAYQRLAKADAR